MTFFLVIGLGAGIVAQIMNFPITYGDYQRIAYDDIKRKKFYQELVIDFFLVETFFVAVSVLLGLGMKALLR